MSTQILLNGTEIAQPVRRASRLDTCARKIDSLADLLDIFASAPPKSAAMLRSTCSLLCGFLNAPPNDVSIGALLTIRDGFKLHLEARHYKPNSVRTYLHQLHLILTHAQRLGWQPAQALTPDWLPLLKTPLGSDSAPLIEFLNRERIPPVMVTEHDIDRWRNDVVKAGHSLNYASRNRRTLWNLLKEHGFVSNLPLQHTRVLRYGTPLADLPDELRHEIQELLTWKLAPYALDRPQDARHRAVTANTLRIVICGIHGFATRIAQLGSFSRLAGLVDRSVIEAFVHWKLNEQRVKPQSIHHDLRLLCAVIRQHPKTKIIETGWLQQLLDGLPIEDRSLLEERKAQAYIDYQSVERIPDALRQSRISSAYFTDYRSAQLAMHELLIKWLTLLPWRRGTCVSVALAVLILICSNPPSTR